MLQVCDHIKHVVVLVALHSCHHFTCQLFPHTHFSLVCEFLADFVDSHTAKTGLLRCCLYTARRLQWTAVSCKRSICNKKREQLNKFVKAVRLRFYPKIEHNGLPRSIINLCMHRLSSTFFEFLKPEGSTPLPPSGRRTR